MNFDLMSTLAAIFYCLGIYLHYIHVHTVFYLAEHEGTVDNRRVIFHSIIWPWTVIQFIWFDIVGEEEDDEE